MSEAVASGMEKASAPEKFPRTFYYANVIELFERMAHYGFYIGLAIYLSTVVGMTDVEVGMTLGNFRFVGQLAPIPCGALADRISFKRSLIIAFVGYASAYATILLAPKKRYVVAALMLAAVSGGFMKPVISGTVVRTSPPGRQVEGFAIFYRMVNAGSVVGKVCAYFVRWLVGIRHVVKISVVASLAALGISAFLYREPKDAEPRDKAPALADTLRAYWQALKIGPLRTALLVCVGYFFMIEQFYMTFPQYMTRHIDKNAPLEIITLINPATIAIAQSTVTRLTKRFHPVSAMTIGILIGGTSMLAMGLVPSIAGACLSGALFAVAEMTFTPRFYDFVASYAPKGKAGLYMGLVFIPGALGAALGGYVSGPLIQHYLPKEGPRNPLLVWATYAGSAVVCALLMLAFRARLARTQKAE